MGIWDLDFDTPWYPHNKCVLSQSWLPACSNSCFFYLLQQAPTSSPCFQGCQCLKSCSSVFIFLFLMRVSSGLSNITYFLAPALIPTGSKLLFLSSLRAKFDATLFFDAFCLTASLWQSIYNNDAPPKYTDVTGVVLLYAEGYKFEISGYLTQLSELTSVYVQIKCNNPFPEQCTMGFSGEQVSNYIVTSPVHHCCVSSGLLN